MMRALFIRARDHHGKHMASIERGQHGNARLPQCRSGAAATSGLSARKAENVYAALASVVMSRFLPADGGPLSQVASRQVSDLG